MSKLQQHWEKVFKTKDTTQVSWYQEVPSTSLELVNTYASGKDATILDVGGGDSHLPHSLVELGYTDITVLDISTAALSLSKSKFVERSSVKYVNTDILEYQSNQTIEVWHDRAVFHFLSKDSEKLRYKQKAIEYLQDDGVLLLATFYKAGGPTMCSGLEVCRHDQESILALFAPEFEIIISFVEKHITPSDKEQVFIWNVLKKKK